METYQDWRDELSTLFERHRKTLRRYALSLTHDDSDADDLLQDAYLRIIEHAQNYDPNRSFTAYAKRVIHNIYVSVYVPQRRREVPLSAFTDSYFAVPSPLDTDTDTREGISADICTPSELELVRKNSVSEALARRLRLRYEMQWLPITDALRGRRQYYDFVYASLHELLLAAPTPCPISSVAREIVQLIQGSGTWILRATFENGNLIVHDAPLVCALAILHEAKYPLPCGRADRVPCAVLVREPEPAND